MIKQLLLLLSPLLMVWGSLLATAHRPFTDCPKGRIGQLNGEFSWSLCTVVRIVKNGRLLEPSGSIASRNPNDSTLSTTLRFGALYLLPSRKFFKSQKWLCCVQGRDTMRICVQPDASHNCLIDSIPFKPGFYYLIPLRDTKWENWQTMPRPEKVSLAPYYHQHEEALARTNPLAGYCFHDRPAAYGPRSLQDRSPVVPTEVFAYLLTQRIYYRRNDIYQLRPFPNHVRAEFARLGAFR